MANQSKRIRKKNQSWRKVVDKNPFTNTCVCVCVCFFLFWRNAFYVWLKNRKEEKRCWSSYRYDYSVAYVAMQRPFAKMVPLICSYIAPLPWYLLRRLSFHSRYLIFPSRSISAWFWHLQVIEIWSHRLLTRRVIIFRLAWSSSKAAHDFLRETLKLARTRHSLIRLICREFVGIFRPEIANVYVDAGTRRTRWNQCFRKMLIEFVATMLQHRLRKLLTFRVCL